jgi:hypothetical protein
VVAGKGVKQASHWVAPAGLEWLQLGQVVMVDRSVMLQCWNRKALAMIVDEAQGISAYSNNTQMPGNSSMPKRSKDLSSRYFLGLRRPHQATTTVLPLAESGAPDRVGRRPLLPKPAAMRAF